MTCCGPNGRLGKPRPMQKGEPGKSAYDIWKENQPIGSDTSLEAYLDSMQGKDGKSAYQIWLDQGNVGTESQFLASLKGKNGEDGTDGVDGKSAYQIWLDAGNTGTEQDFLDSLVGKDGTDAGLPAVPKTVIDTATPMAEVQTAMLSLLQNPATAAANTQWNNVTYPNYPDMTGQVRLTVIPAESGKYLYIGGDLNYPGQGVASMAWASDDGQTTSTMFESFHSGPQIDASLTGTGLFDKLRVQISQSAGNGLSLQTDGLFAAAGGLPGLPAAPLGDQITPQEFDNKVQEAFNKTQIPTEVTAEHYGMNVDPYGGFEAYLITIPVAGDGYYVLASGYIQESPPTKWDVQGYVRIRDGAVDGNPTYIVNDRTDMSLLLKALTLHSSDATVTVTQDGNDFDLKAKTLTRKTGGGNFSFNYPDTKTAKNACGKMGSGVYWKVTVTLDSAGNGNTNVMPQFWTTKIPCMEDGTLVPYKFVVDYVAAANNATPSVAVWLICDGVPTHLMDITTGTATKLQRADKGLTNGLDDLYPLAPEGEFAYEPAWSRTYFYDAFTA